MSFILFAWIACITYAVVVIITKLTSKYSLKNPWYFNFLYNGVILLFITPLALLNHVSLPMHWGNIIPAGIFFAASSLFYILATYELDVSVLSPLFNIRTAFAVILAFFMLHEVLTGIQTLLIAITFIAGIFTTLDETLSPKVFFKRGILWALLCMVFLALLGIYTHKVIAEVGFWNGTFWPMVIAQISLLFTIPLFKKDLRKIKAISIITLLFIGILEAAATLSITRAYATNVGISSVILSLPVSMIFAVILAYFFPKLLEKHTRKVYLMRFAAASVMIVSALLLS